MPAVYSYSTNRPTTNDNEFSLLAKLALTYGLSPTTTDNEFSLLAKLAVAIGTGVTPTPEPDEPAPLFSFTLAEISNTFTRAGAAGFTGSGEAAFQREAAADVARDSHYVSGVRTSLREDDPTPWAGVAGSTPSVTPGELKFSASWTNPAVMASVASLQYQIDSDTPVGFATGTTLTDIAATAGSHTLKIRTVSTSGLFGAWATSASFTVEAGAATFSDNFNRTFESPIQSPWATDLGSHGTISIVANQLQGGGSNSIARYAGTTFAAAHEASVELVTGEVEFNGPAVSCDASGNCYAASYAGSTTYNIYKVASGGSFTVVTSGISGSAPSVGQRLKLRTDGTGVLSLYLDGSLLGTRTDASSPYTTGQPALWCHAGGGADNFQADDV